MLSEYGITELDADDEHSRENAMMGCPYTVIVEGEFMEFDNLNVWISTYLGSDKLYSLFYSKTGYDFGFTEYFFTDETDAIKVAEIVPHIYTRYPHANPPDLTVKSNGYNKQVAYDPQDQLAIVLESGFPVWHLTSKVSPVLLYQSDDANYIVTRDGEWTPIIPNGLYTIINEPLLSFFQQHLVDPIRSHPVSIYDRVLDRYFEGYHRIYIEEMITPGGLHRIAHTGFGIWHYGGHIFISYDLKKALDNAKIEGVETHAGFSHMG